MEPESDYLVHSVTEGGSDEVRGVQRQRKQAAMASEVR